MEMRRTVTDIKKGPTTAMKKTARTPEAILNEHFGSKSARDPQAFDQGYLQCTAAAEWAEQYILLRVYQSFRSQAKDLQGRMRYAEDPRDLADLVKGMTILAAALEVGFQKWGIVARSMKARMLR